MNTIIVLSIILIFQFSVYLDFLELNENNSCLNKIIKRQVIQILHGMRKGTNSFRFYIRLIFFFMFHLQADTIIIIVGVDCIVIWFQLSLIKICLCGARKYIFVQLKFAGYLYMNEFQSTNSSDRKNSRN